MTAPWEEYADKAKSVPWEEYAASKKTPTVVKVGQEINSIPRQLGLTARYGIEGLANIAQLGTEPIRAVTDLFVPDRQQNLSDLVTGQKAPPKSVPLGVLATQFADKIGLPSPANATERVVGDATRLTAGAGGLGAAGRVAAATPGVVGSVGRMFSDNMAQQLSSAAGAGLAGGASREAGGSPLMQAGASFGGGIAGGLLPGAGQSVANMARNAWDRFFPASPQNLDVKITAALNGAGIDYSQVPERVRQSLRADLAQAFNTGADLDPQALRRLVDFRMTGLTPTRGSVTLDPVQVTREMNLAKAGANSADAGLQGLSRVQNANNAALIERLNELGAGRGNLEKAGEAVTSSVLKTQAANRAAEKAAWEAAKGSPGYKQPIEANVVSEINKTLGDEGMIGFLNPTISKYMESFLNGQQPFTPQHYRNLQSMLSNELARGGNEAAAAGLARSVLEKADLRPIVNPKGIDFGNAVVTPQVAAALRAADAAPGNAMAAVDAARAATRGAYAYEGSSPLVKSVLSEGAAGDPMRIAKRFIIGGTPNEARTLANEVGEAGRGQIKDAIVAHLKESAIGKGTKDEVGKFSQSAYNKALEAIGADKLKLFFSPEEIAQLKALGRVASYVQVQPVGSAVNNSNTASNLIGKGLDALAGLSNSTPFVGPMVSQPITGGLNNLGIAIRSRQAQNVAPGLLLQRQRPPLSQGLLLPAAASGGLLLAPKPGD